VLVAEQRLPLPPHEVFPFFADARNLERITPPFLGFRVLTPGAIAMGEGALIDYRLRLHGIPLRWRTRIAVWDPPHRFVDDQLRGPYRRWRHEHAFLPDGEGTVARDRVEYELRGPGRLTGVANHLLVARDLDRVFRYRADRLEELLGDGLLHQPHE
jgi:ligand-binding SRPBCC domain-containing protein